MWQDLYHDFPVVFNLTIRKTENNSGTMIESIVPLTNENREEIKSEIIIITATPTTATITTTQTWGQFQFRNLNWN